MTAWNAVVFAAASGAARSGAIPFRQDAVADGATLMGALLVTVILLGVVALAAWHARRRGWLDRWVGPRTVVRNPAMRVEQALRLSPRTTVYRVRSEGRLLLVVESTANVSIERTIDEGSDEYLAQGGAHHEEP